MVHSSQRKYDSANHVQPTHAWCDRTCCSEVAVKCDCAALLIVPGCKHSAVSFRTLRFTRTVHCRRYTVGSPFAKAACAGPLDAIVICCQRFSASQIALQYERDIFPSAKTTSDNISTRSNVTFRWKDVWMECQPELQRRWTVSLWLQLRTQPCEPEP